MASPIYHLPYAFIVTFLTTVPFLSLFRRKKWLLLLIPVIFAIEYFGLDPFVSGVGIHTFVLYLANAFSISTLLPYVLFSIIFKKIMPSQPSVELMWINRITSGLFAIFTGVFLFAPILAVQILYFLWVINS